ncbi:hypothetical protein M407DRAFT_30021 [Tulasnella calospora MUT 4182]|uniref:Uncharacterized protein n=1 Tax=Tulasnella calospora MUT 4182 TaxID=1051891 RepID=A0A0C3Q829_9AGAM|nr:hypothetical protein M407DRAFT_30021 [Tulasnella calospora MUT 4182]
MPKVTLSASPLCRQGAFVANPRRPTVTKTGTWILDNDPTPSPRHHRRPVSNPSLRREKAFYGYTMSAQECRRLGYFSQPAEASSQPRAGMVEFYSQP